MKKVERKKGPAGRDVSTRHCPAWGRRVMQAGTGAQRTLGKGGRRCGARVALQCGQMVGTYHNTATLETQAAQGEGGRRKAQGRASWAALRLINLQNSPTIPGRWGRGGGVRNLEKNLQGRGAGCADGGGERHGIGHGSGWAGFPVG